MLHFVIKANTPTAHRSKEEVRMVRIGIGPQYLVPIDMSKLGVDLPSDRSGSQLCLCESTF